MNKQQYSHLSHYLFSHPSQKLLTPAQYGMSYREASKREEIQRYRDKTEDFSTTQFIVCVTGEEILQRPLVLAHWSGSRLMVLRSRPIVIGYCSFEEEEEEHSRLYSELLLFRPWKEERRFVYTTPTVDECRNRHAQEKVAIDEVREELKKLLLGQIT